jgi:hypothetical protein
MTINSQNLSRRIFLGNTAIVPAPHNPPLADKPGWRKEAASSAGSKYFTLRLQAARIERSLPPPIIPPMEMSSSTPTGSLIVQRKAVTVSVGNSGRLARWLDGFYVDEVDGTRITV